MTASACPAIGELWEDSALRPVERRAKLPRVARNGYGKTVEFDDLFHSLDRQGGRRIHAFEFFRTRTGRGHDRSRHGACRAKLHVHAV